MTVAITITPFPENADGGDETGLTQDAYDKLTKFLSDFAEDYDVNIVRDRFTEGAEALESRIRSSQAGGTT